MSIASSGQMVKFIVCVLVKSCLLRIPEQLRPYLKLGDDSRAKSTPKKSYLCTSAMEEVCGYTWIWWSEQRASTIATYCQTQWSPYSV